MHNHGGGTGLGRKPCCMLLVHGPGDRRGARHLPGHRPPHRSGRAGAAGRQQSSAARGREPIDVAVGTSHRGMPSLGAALDGIAFDGRLTLGYDGEVADPIPPLQALRSANVDRVATRRGR